jgi:hypothetical protein
MSVATRANDTKGPLHLVFKIGLVSIGLGAFGVATTMEGVPILIPAILGVAVIASAFSRRPGAIFSYTRSRRGPKYEAFFAIASPFALTLVTAWVAFNSAFGLYYVSAFYAPHWTEIADPVIYAAIALMNLGVLVSNAVSLRRRS